MVQRLMEIAEVCWSNGCAVSVNRKRVNGIILTLS